MEEGWIQLDSDGRSVIFSTGRILV
jgi:hypothetical protein